MLKNTNQDCQKQAEKTNVDLRTTLKKIKAIILIFCWTVSIQVNHAEGHPDFAFS